MSRRPLHLAVSILIALAMSACDQDSGSSGRRHGEPTAEEVGRLIQQVKDALADDRIGPAMTLMDRLLAIRPSQPPSRQLEIDRLDALFAAERAPGGASAQPR